MMFYSDFPVGQLALYHKPVGLWGVINARLCCIRVTTAKKVPDEVQVGPVVLS